MTTPSTAHTAMLTITVTHGDSPICATATMPLYAPTMITSPWAKFSILAMP